MSEFFKTRYPAGGDMGEKLLDAFVAARDFNMAAALRDELDAARDERRRSKWTDSKTSTQAKSAT